MNETCLLVMYLSDKDDCEEECIGVDQTFALLPGTAAAHEGHKEDHAANDHQEDRGVHIVVPQEVQVILISRLNDPQYSRSSLTFASICDQAPKPMRTPPATMKRMLKKTMKYFTRLSQQFSMVRLLDFGIRSEILCGLYSNNGQLVTGLTSSQSHAKKY